MSWFILNQLNGSFSGSYNSYNHPYRNYHQRINALQKVEKERRPEAGKIKYDGKDWVVDKKIREYRPVRFTENDKTLQLYHMPGEIVCNILQYLDVQTFYNLCQLKPMKCFLSEYSVLKRFLSTSIHDDLSAGRWELVVFKHRHGIQCGYAMSKKAMQIATSKKQFLFCKYLASVGKSWNWNDLERVLKKREDFRDFLTAVKPNLNDSPTLTYSILRIALQTNDKAAVEIVERYFWRILKTEPKFLELYQRTGIAREEYIRTLNDATESLDTLKSTRDRVTLLKRFPELWKDGICLGKILGNTNAGYVADKCGMTLQLQHFIIALQQGNTVILEKVQDGMLRELITECVKDKNMRNRDVALNTLLFSYFDVTKQLRKDRVKEILDLFPELSKHVQVQKASSFWYRFLH